MGLALKAADRNRSTPVTAVDSHGKLWSAQLEPFLEGEDAELFLCPADERALSNPQSGPSFAANSELHRMRSGDGEKIALLDFGDGDGDGVNDTVIHLTPPAGAANNDWASNADHGGPAWNQGDRRGGRPATRGM